MSSTNSSTLYPTHKQKTNKTIKYIMKTFIEHMGGPVAQQVERLAVNQSVAGSNPVWTVIYFLLLSSSTF